MTTGVSTDGGSGQPKQPPVEQSNPRDPLEGYAEQPFVRAVQLLRKDKLDDVIRLLTEAISEGTSYLVCACAQCR